jgi:transposase
MSRNEAAMASFKVCDPVSVPLCVLEELQQLRRENEQLRQEIERLRRDNQRLQHELDAARTDHDQAQRQAKRQAAPFSKGPPKLDPKRPGRKAGAAHGRHGHRLPPDPARVDEVLEAPLPPTCPQCGGPVRETEVATQYQTEIPRRPIIRQFQIHVGCCCGCGQRVQGRHPLQTSDALGAAAAQIGPEAQAAVVLLNKTFGLSHIKIATAFSSLFGITLTRGASVQIVRRAARRLEPADQEIRQEIRSASCITPDETGWRVGGRPAWLHAWVSQHAIGYALDPYRKADVLERLIGRDWSGTLVHDGFASYDRFTAATHQQCGGHVLRRVRELEAQATRGAVHYPRKLIALFTEAIHLRNRYQKGEVSAATLRRRRPEFDRRLCDLARPAREVPAYQTLSAHLWRHREEWFTFLSHPEVEPTNWEVEQALRPAVVNRKVWGGNRTWVGAHAQEVLMSVLATCKRSRRSGLEFVSQTLCAFANPLLPRPILLTPR